MFFVTLHKPYRGQVDTFLIRADLILEVSTRRHTKKAAEYHPEETVEQGAITGCWILVDRIGWSPCCETPEEVEHAVATAEAAHLRRLAEARGT
jgi:hypothetical protein